MGVVLPWFGVDVEVSWLESERLFKLKLVRGVCHGEIELLDDTGEGNLSLLKSKSTSLFSQYQDIFCAMNIGK